MHARAVTEQDRFTPELAERRFELAGFAAKVLHETSSTNDDARSWASSGAPEFAVVLADTQTSGRGRHGRSWSSPPGASLAMSVVVRPLVSPMRLPQLSLVTGLAVRAALAVAIASIEPRAISLKWPNDVVVRSAVSMQKLAGILVEASIGASGVEHAIVGIGVNVARTSFPPELGDRATSIALVAPESPAVHDRVGLALSIVQRLREEVSRWLADPSGLRARFSPFDVLSQANVRLEDGTCGVACGIDDDGQLRVRCLDGTLRAASAGEVIVESLA